MELTSLDPLSPTFLVDPYPMFARLRDEAPLHFVPSRNLWIVTRYADVLAVARNHAAFSSTGGVGYDWNQRPMMPMYDPPEHTRMRRIVAKHFTPSFVSKLTPVVEKLVEDLIDEALERGSVDVVRDIALPLSLGTIAEILGVRPGERARLRRWSQGTIEDLAGGLEGAEARRVDELRREFNVFLRSLIEERRASAKGAGAAAGDVITLLVAASDDERLTSQELVAFCVLLMVAGHETTANAISNGVLALLEHPDQCRALRANPSLVPSLVEEVVRYDSPVLSFFRNTLTDVTMHGVTIPAKSKVMVAFASANRDERHFPDPDLLRIDREANDHMGYGAGIHFCLGASLARLQMTTLARALVRRTRAIELDGAAKRWANVLFRGMRELPVRLEAAPGIPARSSADPRPAAAPPQPAAAAFESEPFTIHVEDAVLDDLRGRLEKARWPDQIEWAGWDYGSDLGFMRGLVDHWLHRYDWRAQERALNAVPHFRARIEDLTVHFSHIRSKAPTTKPPLLLIHGWPGPFREFNKILDPLTSAEGADGGFDLVVASLPGFPFSSAPRERGMGTMKMGGVFQRLMAGLGYERYGIVGEDWGAGVASRMAFTAPERVVGIHLNMPHENPAREDMAALTPEERAWLREMGKVRDKELTHFPIFQRRPQSIAYGLNDSPVGLAALLVEKYRAWSDCDGDVERRFSKDDLLTNVMLYWVTGTIGSSLRVYFESKQLPWWLGKGERIAVPTAIALTKKEFLQPPRKWIERVYDLERLTHIPAGGHFGAWEEPLAYAADIRAFFADRR